MPQWTHRTETYLQSRPWLPCLHCPHLPGPGLPQKMYARLAFCNGRRRATKTGGKDASGGIAARTALSRAQYAPCFATGRGEFAQPKIAPRFCSGIGKLAAIYSHGHGRWPSAPIASTRNSTSIASGVVDTSGGFPNSFTARWYIGIAHCSWHLPSRPLHDESSTDYWVIAVSLWIPAVPYSAALRPTPAIETPSRCWTHAYSGGTCSNNRPSSGCPLHLASSSFNSFLSADWQPNQGEYGLTSNPYDSHMMI